MPIRVLYNIDFVAKRVVAYPLVVIGLLLTFVAKALIFAAAWLTDQESVINFTDS